MHGWSTTCTKIAPQDFLPTSTSAATLQAPARNAEGSRASGTRARQDDRLGREGRCHPAEVSEPVHAPHRLPTPRGRSGLGPTRRNAGTTTEAPPMNRTTNLWTTGPGQAAASDDAWTTTSCGAARSRAPAGPRATSAPSMSASALPKGSTHRSPPGPPERRRLNAPVPAPAEHPGVAGGRRPGQWVAAVRRRGTRCRTATTTAPTTRPTTADASVLTSQLSTAARAGSAWATASSAACTSA